MDFKTILGIIAVILAFVSSFIYIKDILRGNSKPHSYTWLVWAIVTGIAFFGQLASGGGPGSWLNGASSLLTLFTLILSLKGNYGNKNITSLDKVCLFLSLIAILPWLLVDSILWSVILASLIDIVAFFPTVRKTWHAPKSESLGSMFVDSIKYILSIIALSNYSLVTLIYPLAVLFTKFVMVGEILYLRKIRKVK